MSKIALVHLPNKQLLNSTMYFSLGLLYIAAVLRKHNHEVKIIDLRDKPLKDFWLEFDRKSDFVGFTATTAEIQDAKILSTELKQKYPQIVTIVGGPHPSLLSEDCKGYFDCIVVGEGENEILNIVEWNARGIVHGERIKDLDAVPFPAWDLLQEERRFSYDLMPGEKYGTSASKAATIIASRGCPGKCCYCGNLFMMPVTFRSPLNIFKEAKWLKEQFGVNEFRFEDDNFTLRKSWQKQLCDLLTKLNVQFKCHTRADLLTEEKAIWAKQAGCVEMGIGVESGDDNVLKIVRKQETTADFKRAIDILKLVGIRSKVYLMSALPTETEESIELTKQFMREAQPDKWTLSVFCIYPGNAIFKDPNKFGIKIENHDYANYWNFPDQCSHSFTDGTTSKELYSRYLNLYQYLKDEKWRS